MKTKLICFTILIASLSGLDSFAQTPGEPNTASNTTIDSSSNQSWGFTFSGGSPASFIAAIDQYYKTDWAKIAQIPDEMRNVEIPRMRLPPNAQLFSDVFGNPKFLYVVSLYNELAAKKPELGYLMVKGYAPQASIVIFISDKNAATGPSEVKVKAFPIRVLPEAEWKDLIEEINITQKNALEYAELNGGNRRSFLGQTKIHANTKMLVAFGQDAYVTLVQSVVEGFTKQVRAIDLESPHETAPAPKK